MLEKQPTVYLLLLHLSQESVRLALWQQRLAVILRHGSSGPPPTVCHPVQPVTLPDVQLVLPAGDGHDEQADEPASAAKDHDGV